MSSLSVLELEIFEQAKNDIIQPIKRIAYIRFFFLFFSFFRKRICVYVYTTHNTR